MSTRDNILTQKPEQAVCNHASCKFGGCDKLEVYDWLKDYPTTAEFNIIEIRFKNTRKNFYANVNSLPLEVGDIVAVEALPGHDIGIVSLTGDLVKKQLKKANIQPDSEFRKIYRKAKDTDIQKWQEAMKEEQRYLIKSREIAERLKLNMKIGDVESQGDKTKAIFYYIADDRVDFREMIKLLADELKIRIEMRQIGARQEAGRIGGTGPCGRELCCTTWLSNFNSVSTNAARVQDLSMNPQKLAGQCSKLKCCLNYETSIYQDIQKDFPRNGISLLTEDGEAYHKKTDILKRTMWYSYDQNGFSNLVPLSIEKVKEIIELNKKGVKIDSLKEMETVTTQPAQSIEYSNTVGQDSLTRFDSSAKKKSKNKNRNRKFKPNNNPNEKK